MTGEPARPIPRERGLDLIPPPAAFPYFRGGDPQWLRGRGFSTESSAAAWLADCALLTYEEPGRQRAILEAAGFGVLAQLEGMKCGGYCLVAEALGATVIAFRGTRIRVFRDVLTDLRLALTHEPGLGRVHRGFQSALDEIWGELERRIATLGGGAADGGAPLWMTGHSLGGALAVLSAARLATGALKRSGAALAGLCTFGCPRVGDRDFRASFDEWGIGARVHRYVHGRDVVPRLPPRPDSFRSEEFLRWLNKTGVARLEDIAYEHVGTLRSIDTAGQISELSTENEPVGELSMRRFKEWWTRTDSWRERLKTIEAELFQVEEIDHHAPVFYATHLWNAALRAGHAEEGHRGPMPFP